MQKIPVFNQSFFAMGTRCEVVLVNTGEELAERTFRTLNQEVNQLENIMSRFIPGSALSDLNAAPAGQWLNVHEELWNVLVACHDFYTRSSGVFDITAGPLIGLWKNKPAGYMPSDHEIEQAKEVSGFNKVEFDTLNKRIRKNETGVEFDLGAIGKGVALDRIKVRLTEAGIKQAFVSFGESSVMALGTHPAGPFWPVGIPNALNPVETIHVFEAHDHVITTSGTILNSSHQSASIRQHIINPVTGFPVNEMKMVSVKSTSATVGEFLSTSLLVLDRESRGLLLSKIKKIEILFINYRSDKDLEKEFIIL
jgi:FAD:protein FMN transferase